MSNDVSVVLLAGGRGSRMGELTANRQKLMMEVDGKPVLTWVLDGISAAFARANVVISTGYHAHEIKDHFGSRYGNLDLVYVSDPETRGTVRGLALARPYVGEEFLFVGGDVVLQPSLLAEVVAAFDHAADHDYMGALAAATTHDPARGHALVVASSDGRVVEYHPDTDTTGSAGEHRDLHLGYYRSSLLDFFEEIADRQTYVEYAIKEAMTNGMRFGFHAYGGPWYHFKYPEDFEVSISL